MLKLLKKSNTSSVNSRESSRLNNQGFSLGEIMIVLVIIGGIMAVVLPKIQDGNAKSKVSNTRMKMNEIATKIDEFQSECGKLPTALTFLTQDDASCRNWTGNPKLKHLLVDAWNTQFEYEPVGKGYNLKSLGADKKSGGSSFDKDIYSDTSENSGDE